MPPRFYDTILGRYLLAQTNVKEGREKPIEMKNDGNGIFEGTNGQEYSIMSPVGTGTSLRLGDNSLGMAWDKGYEKSNRYSVSTVRHHQSLALLESLQSPELKRVLFDTNQAMTFLGTGEGPPANILKMLFLPFPSTYMEFTSGLLFDDSEPGHTDVLHSVILDSTKENFVEIPLTPIGPDGMTTGEPKPTNVRVIQCLAFMSSAKDDNPDMTHGLNGPLSSIGMFVDRTFRFILETGQPLTAAGICRGTADPSEIPSDVDDGTYIACGDPLGNPERYVGWWERHLMAITELACWCLSYMAAKSIHIVSEPLPRNTRRRMERQGIPNPWHIVRVEPKIRPGVTASEDGHSGPSYRHDVQCHLRFNRHKLKDGTWKYTVELVPAHQRGLANALYVPKISRFDGGKIPAREMESYWGKNPSYR